MVAKNGSNYRDDRGRRLQTYARTASKRGISRTAMPSFDFFAMPDEIAQAVSSLTEAGANVYTLPVDDSYVRCGVPDFTAGASYYIGAPDVAFAGRHRFDDYNVIQLIAQFKDRNILIRGTVMIGKRPKVLAKRCYWDLRRDLEDRAAAGVLTNPDVPGSKFDILVTKTVAAHPELVLKTDPFDRFKLTFIFQGPV
jgi:hypothetical protein